MNTQQHTTALGLLLLFGCANEPPPPPPPVTGELLCPASIDAAMVACVEALQADPDTSPANSLLDLLTLCADAEPVADDYDAHCAATPDDPICALAFETFVAEVLPQCTVRARDLLFAEVCVLPGQFRDLNNTPGLAPLGRRTITSADELDATEAEQLILTSAAVGIPVATAEEALAATDDGSVEQLSVLAVGTDRVIVAYSAAYGDTVGGLLWLRGALVSVGSIQDGELDDCAIERGIEGSECTSSGDPVCGTEHACLGVVLDDVGAVQGPGACAPLAALEGEGQSCIEDDACGTGQLCTPFSVAASDGQCAAGWVRRGFRADLSQAVTTPGGVARVPIVVSGVATVPTAARLRLLLGQDAPNPLRVSLENPTGTFTLVADTSAAPSADIFLPEQLLGVPGDEGANGVWNLVIEDLGDGTIGGAVFDLQLIVDTRFD